MTEDEKYMKLALVQAEKALERGEFPVGCVIVLNGEVVAEGERRNSAENVNELDHAEMVALRKFLLEKRQVDMDKLIVYSTLEPCLMCQATLIVNGINNIVYAYEDAMGGGTNLPVNLLSPLYKDRQLKITSGVMREESLALMQKFFESEDNLYLKDTYLCDYTMKQKCSLKN